MQENKQIQKNQIFFWELNATFRKIYVICKESKKTSHS